MLGLSLAAQPEHETISVRRMENSFHRISFRNLSASVYTTNYRQFAWRAELKQNQPRICADEHGIKT
jgi:hypothetical protein